MDDKIEPGEAGKAQAIWGAAFPERAPLASQAAGKLGHKLGWRVTRFAANQAMTQESAKRKSRKTWRLARHAGNPLELGQNATMEREL